MPDNIIFYIVFTGQIWLLSIYFPGKIYRRVKTIINDYPQSEYPKLYIKSADYYELGLSIQKNYYRVILVIGLLIIGSIAYTDYYSDERIEGVFSLFYFFLQMLPVMAMEISGFSHFKKMRQADRRTVRKAQSQPRRLFDFVSARMVVAAVVTNVVCVLYVFYLDDFVFEIGSDAFIIFVSLALSNALYAFIIRFNINGKKQDPYIDASDRIIQIRTVVRVMIICSIVAAIFIMLQNTMQNFELNSLKAAFVSIYLQLIVWLSLGTTLDKLNPDNMNFDVYKKDMEAE